jgi:hypothetical protein
MKKLVTYGKIEIGENERKKFILSSGGYFQTRIQKFPLGNYTVTLEEYSDNESKKKRGFFEAAIIGNFCDATDGYEPTNADSMDDMREIVKIEFSGEFEKSFTGETIKISKSTKGRGALDRVIEMCVDYFMKNGMPIPDSALYKKWRDELNRTEGNYWKWLRKNNLEVDGSPKELSTP